MVSKVVKIVGKLFSFAGGVVFTLVIVGVFLMFALLMYSVSHFMGRNSLDVSRRVMSPDHTKTAFLLRDYGFDLNFGVTVIYGGDGIANAQEYSTCAKRAKTLLWTGDFPPYLDTNWNENIEWSADSSFLKMTIHRPKGEQPLIWGYDFKSDRKIKDPNEVQILWLERNLVQDSNDAASAMVVD